MSIISWLFGPRKCRHDWEYSGDSYDPEMTRKCRKCGEIQRWKEVHYGVWE